MTISKPTNITIVDQSGLAFARAAVLIREGYIFSLRDSVETFHSGDVVINLVLGELDADAIKAAAIAVAKALELQNARSEQAAAVALVQTAAHQAQVAAKEILAKEVADTKAKLKALEKQFSKA